MRRCLHLLNFDMETIIHDAKFFGYITSGLIKEKAMDLILDPEARISKTKCFAGKCLSVSVPSYLLTFLF